MNLEQPDQLVADLIHSAKHILKPILKQHGTILYSSHTTLRPGNLYLLGLNPGGNDDIQTIESGLETMEQWEGNAYIDEDWISPEGENPVCFGKHRLQKRVRELLKRLGYDVRQVCASNLIFTRSPNQHGARYPDHADICWPVHANIIRIVQPKALLVYGIGKISPFSYIREKGLIPAENVNYRTREPGSWNCASFNIFLEGKERIVIGMPHLSRYNPLNKTEVISWIEDQLKQIAN